MPDLEAIDERLWELYESHCKNNGVRATIKDFLIWLDENYD